MQAYGVDGNLLSLITDFLGGRSQRVSLPGGTSTRKSVLSGVSQGSVLGLLLFLICINDVSDLFRFNVLIKLFADDIKIHMEIENNSQDVLFKIMLILCQIELTNGNLNYRTINVIICESHCENVTSLHAIY